MVHVYDGFGSIKNRQRFVCKSDINGKLIREFSLENLVSVSDVKEVFENIKDSNKYVIVKTGSSKDLERQKHTKFVNKQILYNEVINECFEGFPKEFMKRV